VELEDRRQAVEGELAKVRAGSAGRDQELAKLKKDVEERASKEGELDKALEKEQEKAYAAENKLSAVQWQVKEAQDRMENALKDAKQAREDYDRMNAHNIRLMSEVQSLRAEVARRKEGGGAAPAAGAAPAPGPALAQLQAGGKGSAPAGKWKYMVTKLPPVPAATKDAPGTSVALPGAGDWDLVTVVREPDGSCLCFFKTSP
jgi:hypothetical protein